MPVSSVNSFTYFCRLSPRGPLARITSSLVPAYFFQLTSARAGSPVRLSAPAAAVPVKSVRREMLWLANLVPPSDSFSLGGILATVPGVPSPNLQIGVARPASPNPQLPVSRQHGAGATSRLGVTEMSHFRGCKTEMLCYTGTKP